MAAMSGGGGGPPTTPAAPSCCSPPSGPSPAVVRAQRIHGGPDAHGADGAQLSVGPAAHPTEASKLGGAPCDSNPASNPAPTIAIPTPTAGTVHGAPPVRLPAAPATGCVPLPAGAPTFAQVLLRAFAPSTSPFPAHPPASTDSGEPAAFFTSEEIAWSCEPLRTAVVARTPQGRPPFPDIRSHLRQRFRFQQDFVISALDKRHLLIRFQDHEDFLQVLLKESMFIQGRPFRFFQWTMEFSPNEDSPIVPLWMVLPQLPANFFTESMIRSIAGSVGTVLKVDKDTLCMACTQGARVNVQLDVSKQLPDRVWIGYGSRGFWQPIVYPHPPRFCKACGRLGHLVSSCKRSAHHHSHEPDDAASSQGLAQGRRMEGNGPRQAGNMKWRPLPTRNVNKAPCEDLLCPTPAMDKAASTAHHMLEESPQLQPVLEPEMGTSSYLGSGPYLSEAATKDLQQSSTAMCDVAAPDSSSKPTTSAVANAWPAQQDMTNPGAGAPLDGVADGTNQALLRMIQSAQDFLDDATQQPRGTYYTSEPGKTDGSPTKIRFRTPKPKGCTRAATSTGCPGADRKTATSEGGVNLQQLSTPAIARPRHELEAPPPETPSGAAPSATTQLPAAPCAPKVRGEAPPALRPKVAHRRFGMKGDVGRPVIGLPAWPLDPGAPEEASSSTSENEDEPCPHNAWAGRTRSTATLTTESDGAYADCSD